MQKKRAFLKWAGGKYNLLEQLTMHLPKANCLVEPFVGAGSVFLNTDYPSYILSDINPDLINLFNVVKFNSDEFIRDARHFFTTSVNNAVEFYRIRQALNQCKDTYLRSLFFLYLNRHCYNGLCRYNLSGEFNAPFGRYKKPYFPEKEMIWFAEKAQKATFLCMNYQQTLAHTPKGAVVYCDPPYAPLSISANFTAYHTKKFTLTEQIELVRLAAQLSQKNRTVVLISNHDTAFTRHLYQEAAALHVLKACRAINCKAFSRKKINELLVIYR